jgi:hypothetical protein
MKRVVWVLGVILGAAALGWWTYDRLQTRPWGPALQAREIAAQVLGEYLAKHVPTTKVVVFGNPFAARGGQSTEIYAFESAELHGLKKGFGSPEAIRVVYPELRRDFIERPQSVFIDPKTTTPLSFLVADGAFDKLLEDNPGLELAVSLIGLPVNIRQSRAWQQTAKTRFALLLPDWRVIGGPEAIREAFRSGKLAAAVVRPPGAALDNRPLQTAEYQEEFNRRFILVTSQNIEQLLRQYPQLF